MTAFPNISIAGFFLEAEVAPNSQGAFEARYLAATTQVVSPGSPSEYQGQPNKWGPELRVYFNDPNASTIFQSANIAVENRTSGYKSGEFMFRINNNAAWWDLVENHGVVLGLN